MKVDSLLDLTGIKSDLHLVFGKFVNQQFDSKINMFTTAFRWLRLARAFDSKQTLQSGLKSLFGVKSARQSQPSKSSCEHIDLAVKLLIHELSENQMKVTLNPSEVE